MSHVTLVVLQMESDLEDMRRKLDMAEGSKSAMQQQVYIF